MKAAIYLRVSTDEQAGPGHASLDVQEARCRAYVAQQGWSLAAVERDVESGMKPGRAGYQRVLALARAGDIAHVVVYSASRFGRDAAELLTRVKELRTLGVELHSTAEDLRSFLMLGISAIFSENEARIMLERTMPAKRHKASQGYWLAHAPFGTVNDKGILRPGPNIDMLRSAFQLAADGVGVTEITRRLNAALYPREIAVHTLRKLLRNESLIGIVKWGGIVARAQWEPIIDPAIFDEAQRQLDRRYVERRPLSRSAPYWLLGLAYCRCGGRMVAKIHVRTWGTVYPYMVCNRRCRGYVKIPEVQAWLLAQLDAFPESEVARYLDALATEGDTAGADHERQAVALRAERDRLAQRVRTAKAAHLDAPETFTIADVRNVEAGVRDALAEIERQLARPAPAPAFDIDAIRAFFTSRAWLAEADRAPREFRDVLRIVVERVVIGDEWRVEWVPALAGVG